MVWPILAGTAVVMLMAFFLVTFVRARYNWQNDIGVGFWVFVYGSTAAFCGAFGELYAEDTHHSLAVFGLVFALIGPMLITLTLWLVGKAFATFFGAIGKLGEMSAALGARHRQEAGLDPVVHQPPAGEQNG